MFLRFKRMRGKTSWSVIEVYRDGNRVRQRTVFRLGAHESREAAQAAWDKKVKDKENRDAGGQSCLVALGLTWPTTLEEVQDAYRCKAVEIHPDRGGTTEAMVELNQAYREARELIDAGKSQARR